MKYLLDSNIAVNVMRHPRAAAATRFLATPPADMAISIVTKAEILVGPNRKKSHANELEKVHRFLSRVRVLEFDAECAEEFGRIAAFLFDAGSPVDGMDVEIAATAKTRNMIVVTANLRDFEKIPGLQIENWIA